MPFPSLKIWRLAIRPKTLPAAVSPVVMGTAMAAGDGVHHLPSALWCLAGALAIQIATNLSNDFFDFRHGVDNAARVGPTRVTQAGLISPRAMIGAMIFLFGLAILICIKLVERGGWPIALIGALSMLAGFFYTAGPRPLGYMGLGDILVFAFFGPVAVAGTYYVQSFEMNMAVTAAGFAPGLLSTAILAVNNLRDIETDRASGKRTLAVRFGKSFAQSEYLFCVLGAGLVPVAIYAAIEDHMPILGSSILILAAIPVMKTVLTRSDGPSLNTALAGTGTLLLIYSILFSIGWIL